MDAIVSASVSSFFGRGDELALIAQWLEGTEDAARILCISGIGGIGKSRLAREALTGRPYAMVALESVPVADEGNVELYAAVYAALRLPPDSQKTVRRQVQQELRLRERFILLLDGADRLLRNMANFVHEILAACPRLKILITSRRSAGLTSGRTLVLKPLSPQDAFALFLQTARLVRADFAPTPTAERIAAEAAELLQGAPLALEIAAARAIVLNPEQMKAQLGKQLRFLVRVRPGANRRHQSVRAAIEWSVTQLPPSARRIMAQLSVLRGEFSLEAAEAVCDDDPPALDAIEELRLFNLMETIFEAEREPVYRMLTPIAEYADELLASPERKRVHKRHLAFFEREAEEIARLLKQERWTMATRRLYASLPNLRVAAAYLGDRRGKEIEARRLNFLEYLGMLYMELGLWKDFDRLFFPLENALTPPAPLPAVAPRLAMILGWRAALARRQGDNLLAGRLWEQRLQIMQAADDADGIVNTLFEIVGQAIDERQLSRAREYHTQARNVITEHGLVLPLLNYHVLFARLAILGGDPPRAMEEAETAITILRSRSVVQQNRVYVCTYLSAVLLDIPAPEKAEPLLHEGLRLCHEQKRWFGFGVLLREAARLRLLQERPEQAAAALAVAVAIHEDLESRHAVTYRETYRNFLTSYQSDAAVQTLADRAARLTWQSALDQFSPLLFLPNS